MPQSLHSGKVVAPEKLGEAVVLIGSQALRVGRLPNS